MSYIRVLTNEQIQEARKLREELGYTKKELADIFNVGQTTIWYNLYGRKVKTRRLYLKRRQERDRVFVSIRGLVEVIENLRQQGYTTGDIAQVYSIPLDQVNLIWCKSL